MRLDQPLLLFRQAQGCHADLLGDCDTLDGGLRGEYVTDQLQGLVSVKFSYNQRENTISHLS